MELSGIIRILFTDKSKWNIINDEEKEKNYFILNRIFARQYPIQASALNTKKTDKFLALEIIFNFFKSTIKQPYWFFVDWSKMKRTNTLLSDYDFYDRKILNTFYPELLKEVSQKIKDDSKFESITVKSKSKSKKK